MTGDHFPRGPPPRGIASIPQIEYFQIAFIGLYISLAIMLSKKKKMTDAEQIGDKKIKSRRDFLGELSPTCFRKYFLQL